MKPSKPRKKPALRSLNTQTLPPAVVVPETLKLPAGLEIKDVEKIQVLILAALQQGTTATFDVGQVSAVDTAGVQLLLAAQREAQRRAVTLVFTGESAPLTQACASLGLRDPLSFAVRRD